MSTEFLSSLPAWVAQVVWSGTALLIAYFLGHVMTRTVCHQLNRWAAKTAWKWDDVLVAAVRRGIPIWSVLVGCYVALGFWHQLPLHVLDLCNRAIAVLVWLSVTVIAAGATGELVVLYGAEFRQALPATSLTRNIATILVVIFGVLMILNSLGISIVPLLTALGVGGLAVALALQDTLANLFAGFYLTMARQVRVGDYVKLEGGQEGYVEDIGWRATQIRTLPNNMVLVPNKKLGETIITNYYLPDRELAVLVEVGVDYSSDLAQVEWVTCEVAREVLQTVSGGVPGCEPLVRFHTFGEYGINGTVTLRAREFVDQYLLKHEFIKRLNVRYKQAGIVVPSIVRVLPVTGQPQQGAS